MAKGPRASTHDLLTELLDFAKRGAEEFRAASCPSEESPPPDGKLLGVVPPHLRPYFLWFVGLDQKANNLWAQANTVPDDWLLYERALLADQERSVIYDLFLVALVHHFPLPEGYQNPRVCVGKEWTVYLSEGEEEAEDEQQKTVMAGSGFTH